MFGDAELHRARDLIALALDEDLDERGDLTGQTTIPEEAWGRRASSRARWAWRRACRSSRLLAELYNLIWTPSRIDGDRLAPDAELGRLEGSMRGLLAIERTALNFLQRLSGIATLTARFVVEVAGTRTVILDTRKTTPGWRVLEKYAVRCGGGRNHRFGLYDMVLIKDNHLAWLEAEGDPIGPAPLGRAATYAEGDRRGNRGRYARPVRPQPLELECRPDIILVDNFGLEEACRGGPAGATREAPSVLLEASGGITLATVRALAETGVDRISVGALTHSAPALDIGLDFDRVIGS